MDSEVLKIEEIVMAGGESEATDLSTGQVEQQYATIIIQNPPPPPAIQSYQHESLQCFQCFITFCNSKAKERHMKKSHREEYKQQLQQCDTLFTCYVCDRTFPSSEELTQHQSTHNKEDKPFKCVHCRESFRTFSELTTHRRQVCPERQFTCRECNQTFRSPALLRSHRVSQHPTPEGEDPDQAGKTHRCGKCGRGFEEESELLQHQENHAGNQNCNGASPIKKRGRPPKVDTVCAESKPKRVKTEEPTAKSETEKPEDNLVPQSEPESKNKGPAKRGRPPKQEEKPEVAAAAVEEQQIPCSECDQAFPSLSHLRAHKKEKHTQRKAHACQECEESFNRAEQLETHMTRVHTAGRHACPTCGKSFSRESNLKAHQQSHDKEEEKPGGRGKR